MASSKSVVRCLRCWKPVQVGSGILTSCGHVLCMDAACQPRRNGLSTSLTCSHCNSQCEAATFDNLDSHLQRMIQGDVDGAVEELKLMVRFQLAQQLEYAKHLEGELQAVRAQLQREQEAHKATVANHQRQQQQQQQQQQHEQRNQHQQQQQHGFNPLQRHQQHGLVFGSSSASRSLFTSSPSPSASSSPAATAAAAATAAGATPRSHMSLSPSNTPLPTPSRTRLFQTPLRPPTNQGMLSTMRRPSGVTSAGPANRLLATPTRTPAVPSMTPASTPSSTPPRLRSPSPARNLLRPGSGRGRAGGAVTGFGTPRAPPSRGAQRPKTPLLSAQGARRQAHGGSSSSYGVSRPSRPPGPAASFGSYQSSRPTMSHSNTHVFGQPQGAAASSSAIRKRPRLGLPRPNWNPRPKTTPGGL